MDEYIVPPKKRRKYRIKPSVKQIKALQLINQGSSVRSALKKAGYSQAVANKSTDFFKQPGVQRAVQSMKGFLENVGLTNQKMALKIAEFVDAKKWDHSVTEPDKEVPDYKTQIEGVKMWNEILNRNFDGAQGKKKRELTITEFVTGEEESLNS